MPIAEGAFLGTARRGLSGVTGCGTRLLRRIKAVSAGSGAGDFVLAS